MGFKENLAFFKKVIFKNIVMCNQNWFIDDSAWDNFDQIVITTYTSTSTDLVLLQITRKSSPNRVCVKIFISGVNGGCNHRKGSSKDHAERFSC